MHTAAQALKRLQEGNQRFVSGLRCLETLTRQTKRADLLAGQNPFAVILGCSDSRVPVEIIFDQGLGDLFVIRVAGNIVAPSQIGSVEFAVEQFGTPLVVVMGHTHCGAIKATLQELQGAGQQKSQNLHSIVSRIQPSVESLLATDLAKDDSALQHAAMRANVRVAANHLRHGSEIIEKLIVDKRLSIVGAEYNLETGAVDFFDGADIN